MSFIMRVMFFGVDAILLSIGVETCDKWNWIGGDCCTLFGDYMSWK